jgi:RNA-directed DNA polymerase
MPSATHELFIRNLTAALLAGPWTPAERSARARRACGPGSTWLRGLSGRINKTFAVPPSPEELEHFLRSDKGVARAAPQVGEWFWLTNVMRPHSAAVAWGVPSLTTPMQLAEWLGVSLPHLEWLADCAGRNSKLREETLRHYRCTWLPKRRGGHRLLEAPKPRLKQTQRKILHDLLDRIPQHESVHGFRPGRSIATYAHPHAARDTVLRFDLRDFFASVPASRVHSIFRTAGYPVDVARLLTGLCTTAMPADVWHTRPGAPDTMSNELARLRFRSRHLPQGAPTSPALANLAAYRFDCRLTGLAAKLDAVYTRYADDLAFSGGEKLLRSARRFQVRVAVIALEEGFELHCRKSRFMRQGVRQQLAGIVVNVRTNVPRADYDELRATLFNCVRFGPESQNRSGHPDFRNQLLGRIAYIAMLNPERGRKLRQQFDRIVWPE